MSIIYHILEMKTLLKIDGMFVGAYDTLEQAEAVVEAYRGR